MRLNSAAQSDTFRLALSAPTHRRNAKCDVLVLWGHIHRRRDVFVTADRNFYASSKLPNLIALGAGRIECPKVAVASLAYATNAL